MVLTTRNTTLTSYWFLRQWTWSAEYFFSI